MPEGAALGRRPNTVDPNNFFSVSDSLLVTMSDAELLRFADEKLGIVLPRGTTRGQILTKLVNVAVAVQEVG